MKITGRFGEKQHQLEAEYQILKVEGSSLPKLSILDSYVAETVEPGPRCSAIGVTADDALQRLTEKLHEHLPAGWTLKLTRVPEPPDFGSMEV